MPQSAGRSLPRPGRPLQPRARARAHERARTQRVCCAARRGRPGFSRGRHGVRCRGCRLGGRQGGAWRAVACRTLQRASRGRRARARAAVSARAAWWVRVAAAHALYDDVGWLAGAVSAGGSVSSGAAGSASSSPPLAAAGTHTTRPAPANRTATLPGTVSGASEGAPESRTMVAASSRRLVVCTPRHAPPSPPHNGAGGALGGASPSLNPYTCTWMARAPAAATEGGGVHAEAGHGAQTGPPADLCAASDACSSVQPAGEDGSGVHAA